MDRASFFAALRKRDSGLFGTKLSQGQVEGMEAILTEAERRRVDLRHLAYILATAYHETARTMQPLREMGGEKYLRSKKYYPWVGEGLVQVTWEENHRKFGATAPGQMMTWPIALVALFDGMLKGMFTGKKLSDYINAKGTDYKGARKIVNGTDKAATITGYAVSFEKALTAGEYGAKPAEPVPDIPEPPTLPEPETPAPDAPTQPEGGVGTSEGIDGLNWPLIAIIGALVAYGAAATFLF